PGELPSTDQDSTPGSALTPPPGTANRGHGACVGDRSPPPTTASRRPPAADHIQHGPTICFVTRSVTAEVWARISLVLTSHQETLPHPGDGTPANLNLIRRANFRRSEPCARGLLLLSFSITRSFE